MRRSNSATSFVWSASGSGLAHRSSHVLVAVRPPLTADEWRTGGRSPLRRSRKVQWKATACGLTAPVIPGGCRRSDSPTSAGADARSSASSWPMPGRCLQPRDGPPRWSAVEDARYVSTSRTAPVDPAGVRYAGRGFRTRCERSARLVAELTGGRDEGVVDRLAPICAGPRSPRCHRRVAHRAGPRGRAGVPPCHPLQRRAICFSSGRRVPHRRSRCGRLG